VIAAGGREGALLVWQLTSASLQGLEARPVETMSAALGLATTR
jgi:hypothetical protein